MWVAKRGSARFNFSGASCSVIYLCKTLIGYLFVKVDHDNYEIRGRREALGSACSCADSLEIISVRYLKNEHTAGNAQ